MRRLSTFNTFPGEFDLLRIVSGKLRGRKLRTRKGQTARPTLEKTRESIFNILQSRCNLTEYEALDLFAGSGALGFEAFSRGAARVVFTEIDRAWFALLRSNIQLLSLGDHCSASMTDALRWLQKTSLTGPPKLFLLDPPYRSDLAQKTLDLLGGRNDVPEDSIIVLETTREKELVYPDRIRIFRQKIFGGTRVDFAGIS